MNTNIQSKLINSFFLRKMSYGTSASQNQSLLQPKYDGDLASVTININPSLTATPLSNLQSQEMDTLDEPVSETIVNTLFLLNLSLFDLEIEKRHC